MRRRILLGLLLGILAFGVLAFLSLLPALRIQRELVRAKSAIEAGRDAFFLGDLPTARHRFDEAASAFIQARSRVDTPFLNLASIVPLVGRTPDSITAMATAGATVASAGSELAHAVARLPGGLGAFAPEDGRISLQRLRELRPVLARVSGSVEQAARILAATERAWVLPQVADARRQFEAPLKALDTALRSASAVAARLPEFLGERGLRRYFVAAQNPAELRGTGGFIGSWAILYAQGGRVRFSTFNPIENLPDAIGKVRPPSPDFAERYDGFGGAGFWRNINITPDFPSAAVAIERLFERVADVELDGVIAADPHALAALLGATGPVRAPALRATLNADNVVAFTTNTAYSRIRDTDARKQVLGDAAKATLDRFVEGTRDRVAAIRALSSTVAEGHLMFHAVDEDIQEAFLLANVAGRLHTPSWDFVSISATNAAANKLDFYSERGVAYDVRLNADGSATSALEVLLRNAAPTRGQPQYVIGPYPGVSGRGESVSYLSAYCGSACELDRHTIDGEQAPVGVERELGHRVFSEFVRIPAGGQRSIGYELSLANGWLGDSLAGKYRLTFQNQPGLVNPTTLTVRIQAPPGTAISLTSLPMEIDGGVATWTGEVGKSWSVEVEFEKSLAVRAWTKFVRFLVKPLA
jgi:hypothetical protein